MSDVVRGYGEMRRAVVHGGRHAVNEEAVLTPIFHALRHSGWRGRQVEAPSRRRSDVRAPDVRVPGARGLDPVDEFRRDPLTAPIPVQAFDAAAAPSPVLPTRAPRRRRSADTDTGAHALVEPREGGRHHFRLETAGSH
ncbi:hypothetical protein [Pseudonocardia hydrocarbonoxydans]|uniref:Uncharacterized protein n=1 Tax=Pseudonocardia hydrocarbonoxydans TaxID=76726 RepID=A0A4Y3WSH5_9PSEU|nr:hypothetical protein [Pseudonocardia hydrocarbonoxydans]GEC21478.1 hypothetical protein PHY01_37610 [Pseudonocardia hydrocarbonoxydans]